MTNEKVVVKGLAVKGAGAVGTKEKTGVGWRDVVATRVSFRLRAD